MLMSRLHIVFDNPVIPTNTGNAIRTAAVTGGIEGLGDIAITIGHAAGAARQAA